MGEVLRAGGQFVLGADKPNAFDSSDLDSAVFHRRADTEAVNGIIDVGLEEYPLLAEQARTEDNHGDKQQKHSDDDENPRLEVTRFRTHSSCPTHLRCV